MKRLPFRLAVFIFREETKCPGDEVGFLKMISSYSLDILIMLIVNKITNKYTFIIFFSLLSVTMEYQGLTRRLICDGYHALIRCSRSILPLRDAALVEYEHIKSVYVAVVDKPGVNSLFINRTERQNVNPKLGF